MSWEMPIGAQTGASGTCFRVWVPDARRVELLLYVDGREAAAYPLERAEEGYFVGHVAEAAAGTRYMYRINGGPPRPDPASRSQPDGPHGPSQVIDPHSFAWSDQEWRGVALDDLVVYELHVGAATPEGTFESLVARLEDIRSLGATAIELMPVAEFPGRRNWGYDGVDLFAPAMAYGGPDGLRRLVDAAHAQGLAVLLDVVYNHLGPDGNYLRDFSRHYFTDRHHTPWGDAVNVDGPQSRPVREFFIANALHWAHEYHIDGLRLDATDMIIDDSPTHLLAEMATRLRQSLPPERHFLMIAENGENQAGVVTPWTTIAPDLSDSPEPVINWGLDGVWADDFHHQVRVTLTGEQDGYYADYGGGEDDLATTIGQGWFYTGQPTNRHGRPRGTPADTIPPMRFIYCIQNHDQVGNRALGDRLNHEVGLDSYRAASALLLLLPHTPLIWMGQEWAASTPFLFFTDHNPELGRLVTEGRRKEFAQFRAFSGTKIPDPQEATTFERSKLRWAERMEPPHAGVYSLYRDLLLLRHTHPALRARDRASYAVAPLGEKAVGLRQDDPAGGASLLLVVNLGGKLTIDLAAGSDLGDIAGREWAVRLDSEDARYGGRGPARLDGTRLALSGPGAVLLEG